MFWGSLGLNFDYDGGPIFLYIIYIEFIHVYRILEVSTSFHEGIRTGFSCQIGVAKHQVIFVSRPNQLDRNFGSFFGAGFEMIGTYLTLNSC